MGLQHGSWVYGWSHVCDSSRQARSVAVSPFCPCQDELEAHLFCMKSYFWQDKCRHGHSQGHSRCGCRMLPLEGKLLQREKQHCSSPSLRLLEAGWSLSASHTFISKPLRPHSLCFSHTVPLDPLQHQILFCWVDAWL